MMKRSLSVAVIVYLFFFLVNVAGAASFPSIVQATSTWDIRTPPYTPTAGGGSGGMFPTVAPVDACGCPGGLPIGYGTVTPDALWSICCGQCLPTVTDMASFPTSTADGSPTVTGTPPTSTATVTATATGTASPTSAGALVCGTVSDNRGTCTVMDGGRRLHYEINYTAAGQGQISIIFFSTVQMRVKDQS